MTVGVSSCGGGGGVERREWRRELMHIWTVNEVNEDFFRLTFILFYFCSCVGVLVGGDVVECG